MIFADASAVIAILAGEPEEGDLVSRLEGEDARLLSGLAHWETVAGLVRSYGYTADQAIALTDDFIKTLDFTVVPIGPLETEAAVQAFKIYGKGRHPAALNMGDCFAYGCAKTRGATLLYKGEDFAKTDLA